MNYAQAKKLIVEKLKASPHDPDGSNHYKTILMLRTGVEIKTKEGRTKVTFPIGINLKWLIAHSEGKESPYTSLKFTGRNLDNLIAFAEYDSLAWEAAHDLIDKILEQNDPLPEKLRLFLKSKKKKPKKRGPHPSKYLDRDQLIVECIYLLKECKYAPLAKNASHCEPNSAFHIIAESFSEIGIEVFYDAIRSIWRDYKKSCDPKPEDKEALIQEVS